MTKLLVVTGPPGAGKSVTARVLADRFEPSVLVDGDAFFGFVASGAVPPWLPESRGQNDVVISAAGSAAGRYAAGGYATVFDGIVGPWYLPHFLVATGMDRLDYVVLMPSVDRCLSRVVTRRGHAFRDEAATRAMYREFAESVVDERHVLRDPRGGPEVVAELVVAALESGALAYPGGSPAGVGPLA